jgi:hypothetical protein
MKGAEQSTGLVPRAGALPLRDSAGITPDFAGIHATPGYVRGIAEGTVAPGRTGMLGCESIAPSRGQGIRSKSGADAQR